MATLPLLKPRAAVSPRRGRVAIIDIGSNSVRLVVYQGPARIPYPLFNEKVIAGLGEELDKTGRIGDLALERCLMALTRFALLCAEMQVEHVQCVATAAVRDAENGVDLIRRAAQIGLNVEILTGEEEGLCSAFGLISGITFVDGIAADLGGGSLELVRIRGREILWSVSLPLGSLRIAEIRSKGKGALRARLSALLKPENIQEEPGLPFYLIGGSWRSLARVDMHLTRYPLPILHQYEMEPGRADKIRRWVTKTLKADPKLLIPYAGFRASTLLDTAYLLSSLSSRFHPSRFVVSAFGLREGLLYGGLSRKVALQDPLLVRARDEGGQLGRFPGHGDKIHQWIAPLFSADSAELTRIRHAACLLGDVGWHANPEFRAERGLEIALHGNWVGIDICGRALLAQALFAQHTGWTDIADAVKNLAPEELLNRATQWGLAIRLAQRLSGGVEGPLNWSSLTVKEGTIILRLDGYYSVLAGEAVDRRLRMLGQAMEMGFVLDCTDIEI